ncbi:MAG: DNA-processing protein DprA [Myxococcales bacterium]|nr:DNA-processing protein DprA [Myxococcales bacterium]
MHQTTTLLRTHPSYPSRLRDIPGWPKTLNCHGRLSWSGPAVAVVGARAASKLGMSRARELASQLAAAGHHVISGGALGVDSAAHEGALAAGGYTLAVMACGLDNYYPRRNQALFEAILARGGAIVSPYEAEAMPLRGRFVSRNQIIAALADIVVVVEACTNSGSLHTARFALGLGRKLAVVAGSPGCEALIAQGVPAIESSSGVTDVLAGNDLCLKVQLPSAASLEGRVLHTLSAYEARSASELHLLVELPLRKVQRIVVRLHLESLAIALPGQRYLLSPLAIRALEARNPKD